MPKDAHNTENKLNIPIIYRYLKDYERFQRNLPHCLY